MTTYFIRGYTSSYHDFEGTCELPDNFDFEGARWGGDPRYVSAQRKTLFEALLDSPCDSEYLDVFSDTDFEVRDDLANVPGEIVLLAESTGCENCCDVSNEYTDGCDDETPHGGFMITLMPLKD